MNVEVSQLQVDDMLRIGPGEKNDKPYVKLAAMLMWGSKHLMKHSTDGRKDPKNVTAIRRPALDLERLDAIRGKTTFCSSVGMSVVIGK